MWAGHPDGFLQVNPGCAGHPERFLQVNPGCAGHPDEFLQVNPGCAGHPDGFLQVKYVRKFNNCFPPEPKKLTQHQNYIVL
jgi:hypothetical protein